MQHRFTIIIPTRERAETLEYTLKTCTAQDYDNLEIIVSDNASRDATREVVAAAGDSRIRYVNPGRRLSMMENFEYAYSHVGEGYVYSMGDDDAIARNALHKVNEIICQTSAQAVVSDFAHYMWPNVLGSAAGQLIASKRQGYVQRDAKADLRDMLYKRRPFNHLPCIYYGFVHAQLLSQLRQMHGKLFLTNVVDLFSSIALSLSMDSYIFSNEPLAINGTSSRSNGASLMRISSNTSEKDRWHLENSATSIAPFTTTASIKMMMAEACYAIEQAGSPLRKKLKYDLSSLLRQSHLDVILYAKSNIDPNIIERICMLLGHPGLSPSTSEKLLAKGELYMNRIPRFLNSHIIDAGAHGAHNIDAVAQLLPQLHTIPAISLADRIQLLLKRFRAIR